MLKPGIRFEDHAPLEFTSVVGKAAMLEGLAEAATQLAGAALVCARFIRRDNPPEYRDISEDTYFTSIRNRVADLFVYMDDLKITCNQNRYFKQVDEFRNRLKETQSEEKILLSKGELKEIEQELNLLQNKLQELGK